MDMTIDLKSVQALADKLVKEAGEMALSLQNSQTIIKQKDLGDMATSSDIACEKFIIDEIKRNYPEHAIYAEESGHDGTSQSEYTWVIDPIDGTKEYARGAKEFNCLIAVECHDELVVGSLYRADTKEVYSGRRGNGALLDGKSIKTSETNELTKSFVGLHLLTSDYDESSIDKELQIAKKIILTSYRLRPGWDDVCFLGYVASGLLEAHLLPPDICRWYDIAPGILLVEEAGGKVTNFLGDAIKNRDLSKGIIASNGKIHDKLLEIVTGYFNT